MSGRRIEWQRLLGGVLTYEQPMAALDDSRFARIAEGFAAHYAIEARGGDGFAFERGEGFDRLKAWDAFAYVDRGRVERLRAQGFERPGIAVFPAGWRALRFELELRVMLIFWIALLVALRFLVFPAWPPWLWIAAFLAIYALHVALVIRSLDAKLARWLAPPTFH